MDDIIERLDKIINLLEDTNGKTVLNYYRKQADILDLEIDKGEQARIPDTDTAANLVAALIEEETLESEAIKMYVDQHKEMGIKTPMITKRNLNKAIREAHPDFKLVNTTRKGVQLRIWKSIMNKHSNLKKKEQFTTLQTQLQMTQKEAIQNLKKLIND